MVRLTRILTGILLVALAFLAYAVYGAQLHVSISDLSIAPAVERKDAFDNLIGAVSRGDLGSNQFRQVQSTSETDYSLITYTVNAKNVGLFACEWAQIRVSPQSGDVALIPGDVQDVPPFGTRTMTATLLVEGVVPEGARDLWLEYYVLGRRMSATAG